MRNSKKNNFYRSLSNALEQFKDSPPDKVWDFVEIDLAKKQFEREKKRFLWMHRLSAVIILFFILFGAYKLVNYNTPLASTNDRENFKVNDHDIFINDTGVNNSPFAGVERQNADSVFFKSNNESRKSGNSNNALVRTSQVKINRKYLKGSTTAAVVYEESAFKSEPENVSRRGEDIIPEDSAHERDLITQISILSDTSSEQVVSLFQFDSTVAVVENISMDSVINNSSDSVLVLNDNATADSVDQSRSISTAREPSQVLSRMSVSAFFSPDYSNRILAGNNGISEPSIAQLNKQEKPLFAFSYGLKIGYELSDRWNVQAGAGYSFMEQAYCPSYLSVDTSGSEKTEYSFMSSSGIVRFSSEDFGGDDDISPVDKDSIFLSYRGKEKIEFVNVPLLMRYKMSYKGISVFATCGITTGILINKQVKLKMLDTPYDISLKTGNISGLRNVNVGFMMGMGLQYNVFRGFSVLMEPTLKFSFIPMNKNNPVKSYPYSLGIATGISYHF